MPAAWPASCKASMLAAAVFLALALRPAYSAEANAPSHPHIVMMLADDLGWYNVGWRNKEIDSPTLDHLAQTGMILNRHYTFKYCSPTRSSLMTGRLPLHVNQNNNCNDVQAPSGADLRFTLLPAKLKQAGYATHMTGKWHGGARSTANLPINRGFDSHLGFLKGGEDHYTQGSTDGNLHVVDLWEDNGPAFGKNGTYSTYLYAGRAVDVIQKHDPSTPLFLYLPWHVTHTPLEAPQQYIKPVPQDPDSVRSKMDAMVHMLDLGIANVTKALQEAGLWNNTLLVFSADNGGWLTNLGGNNYPLRGGKVSDFEGGVRAAAFVNGGVLPEKLRGTSTDAYIHVTDWYATFCDIAGVDPSDPVSGLPDIDSMSVWPLVSGRNMTSPRTEIPLAYCSPEAQCDEGASQGMLDAALISGRYKIVTGSQNHLGVWQGPLYPNGTKDPQDPGCPQGCLFDIQQDPTEHVNLKDSHPDVFQQMLTRLHEIGSTVYQTNYTGPYTQCMSREDAFVKYKGFLGPECFKGNE